MKKALIILAVLLLAAVLLFPFEREISRTYSCNVLDQWDESYSDTVSVVFTGTYYDYLILHDRFVGRIDIPGYEFMSASAQDMDLEIGILGSHSWDSMLYFDNSDYEYPGTFHAAEDLDSFFLWLNVPNESGNGATGRYFLCYPEMTFDEVYAILDLNGG